MGIFVLVDGLGYELVRHCDFLPDFEHRVGIHGVLGDADAAHATFLTGVSPSQHGVERRFVRASGPSLFDPARRYARLGPILADTGWVRARVERALDASWPEPLLLPGCPTRLLPRFDVSHDGAVLTGSLGMGNGIFEQLRARDLRVGLVTRPASDEDLLRQGLAHVREGAADVVFVRVRGLAADLVRHGSASAQVQARLDLLARGLHGLQGAAESLVEELEMFVFGDRAYVDTHGGLDLARRVTNVVGRNGDRVLAFYEPTCARFWVLDASAREPLLDLLERLGQGRLVRPDERAAFGLSVTDRADEELFVLDPGLTIVPNFESRSLPAAAAGYLPDHPYSMLALVGNFSPSLDVHAIAGVHALLAATGERILQDRA